MSRFQGEITALRRTYGMKSPNNHQTGNGMILPVETLPIRPGNGGGTPTGRSSLDNTIVSLNSPGNSMRRQRRVLLNTTVATHTGWVLLGILWMAQTASAGSLSSFKEMVGVAMAGQTSSPSAADKTKQSDDLLRRARQAMAENDLSTAESLVSESDALNVDYGNFYTGDTPKKGATRSGTKTERRRLDETESILYAACRQKAADRARPLPGTNRRGERIRCSRQNGNAVAEGRADGFGRPRIVGLRALHRSKLSHHVRRRSRPARSLEFNVAPHAGRPHDAPAGDQQRRSAVGRRSQGPGRRAI